MNITNISFNKRIYPTRTVHIKGYGERRIAGEELQKALFDADDNYVSDEAREIDDSIFYFVKDSYLATLEDKPLSTKIERSIA
ncbi:MAG: hypothetical protein IK068_03145 [Lachnospiraceae bacterium]|nr:hypothetical protein [Lachnospiraceae bacterium]